MRSVNIKTIVLGCVILWSTHMENIKVKGQLVKKTGAEGRNDGVDGGQDRLQYVSRQ